MKPIRRRLFRFFPFSGPVKSSKLMRMSEIPPKHMPDPSAYEAPEAGSGLVAMYNAASHANAESFPVLKAFQDYIEAERAQARKRVMQLSIFFAVLMGVVVTGFLTAGIFMLRNMSNVQTKLLDVALANKEAPAAQPVPVVQTSPLLEESVRQMSRMTTEMQSSLDKKLDGVSDLTSKVHEKVASQDGELEKLRTELQQMQQQSAKLQNELANMKTSSQKKTAVAAAPITTPAPVAVQPAPPPAPVAAPIIVAEPSVAVAPAAVAAVTPPPAKPVVAAKPARDPRFPPAVKDPPATPAGVKSPEPPKGMIATAIPLKTKNTGTVPWRVLMPE